jgi:hypothetical protein
MPIPWLAGPVAVNKQAKKRSLLAFLLVLPSFYLVQRVFLTHRLSTPLLIPFSCEPFRRGVDKS